MYELLDDIIDESPLRSNLDSPPAYSNGTPMQHGCVEILFWKKYAVCCCCCWCGVGVTPYDAPPPFTGGTMLPFVNAPAPPAATAATAGGAAAAGTIIYSKIPDVSKLAPVNYEQVRIVCMLCGVFVCVWMNERWMYLFVIAL